MSGGGGGSICHLGGGLGGGGGGGGYKNIQSFLALLASPRMQGQKLQMGCSSLHA